MDVKDVTKLPTGSEPKSAAQEAKIRKTSDALLSTSVPLEQVETDVIVRTARSGNKTELRTKVNEVINATNLASEATDHITELVKSISGIVSQAKSEDITPQRRQILEQEANQLVEEIKNTAQVSTSDGTKPLSGDKIRLEVEERIGKTLDIVLPDDAKNAFGLGALKFSTKDAIINTVTSINNALESINKLREAVQATSKNVESAATELDIALQNSEASEASIRDLDKALKVATETRTVIISDPQKALVSLNKLDEKSLGLLK
jgi:flagellin-like hook-associated protein FlgL